ncbi:MAG: SDR family oxidoreductase [Chloroflexi bacterium]|nr:SDR family oxidoreductase [Chloroflexota bacterium]
MVLGASSGFGAATSLELARAGMHIFGAHLDTRTTLPNAERVVSEIKALGRQAVFFNINAADEQKRRATLDSIVQKLEADGGPRQVRVLLHSLAFGTLKLFVAPNAQDTINQKQMDMTLDVMAHSLVYWVQDMTARNLLGQGSRIFAMTSAGSHRIWPSYGAVSAAKASLESHIRQLAVELAPRGVTANAVCAGVTQTPALLKIPGADALIKGATARNPSGRMTTPQDVAQAIAALSVAGTQWITGNVINVDGGEDIVG